MRRIAISALLISATTLALIVSPVGAGTSPGGTTTSLIAYMSGSEERPNPGDPDAIGRATITIRPATDQVCLTLWWHNVDGTLSGLHIHEAPPGSPGPVVVPFAVPPTGSRWTYQCVTDSDADRIAANPQNFYINLHSTPLYPGGALRGQLQFL